MQKTSLYYVNTGCHPAWDGEENNDEKDRLRSASSNWTLTIFTPPIVQPARWPKSFVAGEETVCTGGDGTTGNGAVFFRELPIKVKKLERHPFHGTGKLLARREPLRHFRPHVSFGPGLRAGIREQNGVLFQFAQKVRGKASWERRGEQDVGVEERAGQGRVTFGMHRHEDRQASRKLRGNVARFLLSQFRDDAPVARQTILTHHSAYAQKPIGTIW